MVESVERPDLVALLVTLGAIEAYVRKLRADKGRKAALSFLHFMNDAMASQTLPIAREGAVVAKARTQAIDLWQRELSRMMRACG